MKPTIDISYVRYFLPIYIFGLPFVVLGWQWLAERFGNNWKRLAFYGVTGGFALYFSLFLALWGNDISLFQIKKNIDTYEHRATVVSEMIKSENTVIIIPDWADKVFAQDYLTMFVTNTEKFDLALMNLNKEGVEIYYYSERPDDEVIKFSEQRLVPLGLSLESFGHVFENERMFKLIPLDTF